ncbi:MAG: GntR family transcriptional regulator [Armatimonadetes bacterium]|nr:GntR family transcriptional regulator [Armatimonadota bacterium]
MNEPMPAPAAQSLADQMYAYLEAAILRGRMAPGQRLVEGEIAAWFQTSRSPVRETLRRLERDGLVTISPRRGAIVRQVTEREVLEALRVREVLEGLAAREAAALATPQDVARLRAAAGGRRGGRGNTPAEDFHAVLVDVARNGTLERMMLESNNVVKLIGAAAGRAPARAAQVAAEREAVVRAIAAGDADGAEQAARRHLRAGRDHLVSGWPAEAERTTAARAPRRRRGDVPAALEASSPS